MKTFNTLNPPKRLRISELTLPEDSSFMIDVPVNGLVCNRLRNFNHFSPSQLADYQRDMIKRWGDLVLTLTQSSTYYAHYTVKYASRFRNYLKDNQIGISRALDQIGNND